MNVGTEKHSQRRKKKRERKKLNACKTKILGPGKMKRFEPGTAKMSKFLFSKLKRD